VVTRLGWPIAHFLSKGQKKEGQTPYEEKLQKKSLDNQKLGAKYYVNGV
jgi:hypothetical protein